jgi:hypothetical protein
LSGIQTTLGGHRNELDGLESYTASLKAVNLVSGSSQLPQIAELFTQNISQLGINLGISSVTGSINSYTSSNETWKDGIRGEVSALEAYTASLSIPSVQFLRYRNTGAISVPSETPTLLPFHTQSENLGSPEVVWSDESSSFVYYGSTPKVAEINLQVNFQLTATGSRWIYVMKNDVGDNNTFNNVVNQLIPVIGSHNEIINTDGSSRMVLNASGMTVLNQNDSLTAYVWHDADISLSVGGSSTPSVGWEAVNFSLKLT